MNISTGLLIETNSALGRDQVEIIYELGLEA